MWTKNETKVPKQEKMALETEPIPLVTKKEKILKWSQAYTH